MRIVIVLLALVMGIVTVTADVAKIKPVKTWPRVVRFEGKTYYNADKSTCVKAGYRMLIAKPATPAGKRIKSEEIVQDDKDPSKCKYDIIYEDIPEPVIPDPPVPEVLTNVASDKVMFQFNTNGSYRGVIWIDAPVTNIAAEK